MRYLVRHLFIVIAALALAGASPALAQEADSAQSRRMAPPMPPFRTEAPAPAANRVTAPPMPSIRTAPPNLPETRRTAPPMPPIETRPLPKLSLPTPCFFNFFGCPATHLYVSFGDSVAAGATAVRGYVSLYEQLLEQSLGINIRHQSLARSRQTTSELAQALALNTPGRRALAQAHIVTWNIGGNDFRAARTLYKEGHCGGADNQDCLRATLASFQESWDQIVAIMRETKAQRPTLMRSMDIYNPHVREDLGTDTWPDDGAASDWAALQPYLSRANTHIAQTLTAANIPFAAISLVFNGPDGTVDPTDHGFISGDGFHPNSTGHQILAQELRRLGTADLP